MPRFVTRLGVPFLLSLITIALGVPALAQNAPDLSQVRRVHRLKIDLPKTVALGTPFDVQISFPKVGVVGVDIREAIATDDGTYVGKGDSMENLPVVSDRNGNSVVKVVPLLIGKLHCQITAVFSDLGYSAEAFTVRVGPPTSPPQKVLGDLDLTQRDAEFFARVGLTFRLRPVAFFGSAPRHEFDVQGWATYRLLPSDGAPVVTLAADGTVSALRPGIAMTEVSFAGATSQFPIVVNAH